MRSLPFVLLLVTFLPSPLLAQENLVVNGSFETATTATGLADDWVYEPGTSADRAPSVQTTREAGKVGDWAQAIRCDRFQDAGHVMLAQRGKVAVEKGKRYTLSFWARGEDLPRASVALRDTSDWQDAGLSSSFSPRDRWRLFRFSFTASRSVHETTRLQFWYTSTGALWLDDVVLIETADRTPLEYIAGWPQGRRNCLLNSSFELGEGGWFTSGYWCVHGRVTNDDPCDGRRCLRIEADPDVLPYYSFDYFDPVHRPIESLAVATPYWIALDEGAEYTLSGYARASRAVPGVIGVRFPGGQSTAAITIGEQPGWRRFTHAFRARQSLAHVVFGPTAPEPAVEPATVWLDALQLEPGGAAGDYQPRREVEVAATTEPWRSFAADRPALVPLRLVAWNAGTTEAPVEVRWQARDFWDKPAGTGVTRLTVPAGSSATWASEDLTGAGRSLPFARITVTAAGEELPPLRTTTVLPEDQAPRDSVFGINHAYPWDEWLVLCRRMGITWVRDWTLKWQYVEPEPGRFELDKADYYIERPLRLGMQELCMFPFPSSVWAAEKPPTRPAEEPRLYRPIETAFRPTDPGLLKRYITACVERYRDRIKHWEVFNESIFTTYSLPHTYGYKAEDYVPLLAAAHEAVKRADPGALVVGGYSAMAASHADLYATLIGKGGLAHCDGLSIHDYPGGEPEGSEEAVGRLVAAMREAGAPRPLWLTEFAYYGDDDVEPTMDLGAWPPFVEDETTHALWTARYCLLMLGSGVSNVFFHIWNARVNFDSGQSLFFEADGEPRKATAALCAMVRMLGPKPDFVDTLDLGQDGQVCLLFRRGNTLVAVTWDAWSGTRCGGPPPPGEWRDFLGQPLGAPPTGLDPSPLYLETTEGRDKLERRLRTWIAS